MYIGVGFIWLLLFSTVGREARLQVNKIVYFMEFDESISYQKYKS